MSRKWFSILALIATATLLSLSSCADPQELVGITVQPVSVTFGATNIPVPADAGLTTQLTALGTYLHPPVTKDITNQVTWASSDNQEVTVSSTGLIKVTGVVCGPNTLISATVTTNADGSGVSSSGAVVTGAMTASVVCFTNTSGGSGAAPILTVNFQGSGTGTVTSPTFSCASTAISCVDSFPAGTTVTLTATPIAPSTFAGWSGGACTGTSTCVLLMETDTTVTATFN
jgi:List-Bact-rpt repeat protein